MAECSPAALLGNRVASPVVRQRGQGFLVLGERLRMFIHSPTAAAALSNALPSCRVLFLMNR
jgi:hypothetical protein